MLGLHERVKTTDQLPTDADVLIREARRLRRRRWAIGGVLLLAISAGIGIGVGESGSGGRSPAINSGSHTPADAAALAPNVKLLDLSKSDKYGDIGRVGDRILLYGPAVQERFPSASAKCNSAAVNPMTLALSDLKTGSCANPALQGERVLPVMTVEPKVPFDGGGVATVTVRISHVMHDRAGYALGPVVMSFPQESDGWPSWTYGDGNLWLFDALAKGGSQLLRVSDTTGAVEQRVAMPDISRPIIAVDADGFWLAPAANSGGGKADLGAVYFVAAGASRPSRILRMPNGEYVRWMVVSGHSLWLAPGPNATTVWSLTGTNPSAVHRVALAPELRSVLMAQGNSSAMVGNETGLWTAVAKSSGMQQQVFLLNPSTGAISLQAELKPAYSSPGDLLYGTTKAVAFGGSMYLLDPPSESGPAYRGEGFSALYRITAKKA
jgi:hypothetical protein